MRRTDPQTRAGERRKRLIEIAIADLRTELDNQLKKHGGDANIESTCEFMSLIAEEVGEAAKDANRLRWGSGTLPEALALQRELRAELIQVAALCISAYVWSVQPDDETGVIEHAHC